MATFRVQVQSSDGFDMETEIQAESGDRAIFAARELRKQTRGLTVDDLLQLDYVDAGAFVDAWEGA